MRPPHPGWCVAISRALDARPAGLLLTPHAKERRLERDISRAHIQAVLRERREVWPSRRAPLTCYVSDGQIVVIVGRLHSGALGVITVYRAGEKEEW